MRPYALIGGSPLTLQFQILMVVHIHARLSSAAQKAMEVLCLHVPAWESRE